MILISNIILLILVSNLPPSLGRLGPNSNIENGQTHRELQSSICDQFPWNDDERVKNICIAYCDNCLIEPRPSCDRLKYKLIKATGNSVFPCENRCPCWDEEDLQVLDATNVHQLSCINLHPGYPNFVPPIGAYIETGNSGWYFGASSNFWTIQGVIMPSCLRKIDNEPPPEEASPATEEQLQICINQIAKHCADVGKGFPETLCPCWRADQLDVVAVETINQLSCRNMESSYPYYAPPVGAYIQTGSSGWHFGASSNFWTINGAKQPACIMKVQNLPPPDEATALTDEELQTCIDEISNRCEELGLGYTGTILP